MAGEQNSFTPASGPPAGSADRGSAARHRKGSEWDLMDNLAPGSTYPIKPKRHEGALSKRRKWPLKDSDFALTGCIIQTLANVEGGTGKPKERKRGHFTVCRSIGTTFGTS